MMQEVASDSNGEGAYDFVSDAKKDSPPLTAGSSIPSSMSSSTSSNLSSSPFQPPPGPMTNSLPPGQKPSYAYPPGFSSATRAPTASTFAPPPGAPPLGASSFGLPPPNLHGPSFIPSQPRPFAPLGPTGSSEHLTDISHTLKSPPTRPGPPASSGGQPDLTEIFGSDVMSSLPPLQQNKPNIPVSLGGNVSSSIPPAAMQFSSAPPRGNIAPPPLPPSFPSSSVTAGGVNPFSSQAAAGHLPSFSALGPLPGHGQQQLPATERIPLPQSFGPPGSAPPAPPPVAMMSIPSSGQMLPGPSLGPAFPPPAPQSDASQPYQPIAISEPQSYGQGPQIPGGPTSIDYGAQSASSSPYTGSQPPQYGQQGSYNMGHDTQSSNRFALGGWVQSSFVAVKNVTEKAKSTAFSLMNTLDPQMKQFGASGTSSGDPSSTVGAELTLFYIGNETSLMDALKAGAEASYKSVHIYARSGTAPGHKQQIGFQNALAVATSTINFARSSPQLQNSLLLAVEPFVVELSPNFWYVGVCLVLSDPMTARGDFLHTFSQLTLLTDFGLNLTGPGDQQLAGPLDDLISDRSALMLRRDSWMEQLTGVTFHATVAFAVRQLIGVYKRRHS